MNYNFLVNNRIANHEHIVTTVHDYTGPQSGAPLQPFDYEPDELQLDQVEIAVSDCVICHSDLSMIHNDWGNATYPPIAKETQAT